MGVTDLCSPGHAASGIRRVFQDDLILDLEEVGQLKQGIGGKSFLAAIKARDAGKRHIGGRPDLAYREIRFAYRVPQGLSKFIQSFAGLSHSCQRPVRVRLLTQYYEPVYCRIVLNMARGVNNEIVPDQSYRVLVPAPRRECRPPSFFRFRKHPKRVSRVQNQRAWFFESPIL